MKCPKSLANENSKQKQATCLKRGKTRMTNSRLYLVLHLFSFALVERMGREFSEPITQQSKVKPKQPRITFDTQLKIALREHPSFQRLPTLPLFLVKVCSYSCLPRIIYKLLFPFSQIVLYPVCILSSSFFD